MTEPAAIWSQRAVIFDKTISLTQNIILSQAWVALQTLVRKIDQLHELVKISPPVHEFHLHPDIPCTLSEICFHQGITSTILFNDAQKSSRENNAAYKLRLDRITYVRKKLGNLQVPLLSDRKLRNQLTHIDEYLSKSLNTPSTGWIIDSAIGRRNQFKAPNALKISFCRTYISSEDSLLHLDQEISLKNLRVEALAVRDAIWKNIAPAKLFTLAKNEK